MAVHPPMDRNPMTARIAPSARTAAQGRPAADLAPPPQGGASAPGAGTAAKDVALPLPHERDQSAHDVAAKPDPVMVQAYQDLEAGMVDTDMRATPGLDAQRRAELVPGPGGKPPGKAR